MDSKKGRVINRLAIGGMLLSLASFVSCSATQKISTREKSNGNADRVKMFVPTRPPVVVLRSWRDSIKNNL